MNLKTIALAGACLAAVFTAGGASAATIVGATGTPLFYMVHNVAGGSDSTHLTLDTNPSSFIVDYTSSSVLHDNGSSGGFAQVRGVGSGNGDGFTDLTIDPRAPITGFTAIKFKFDITGDLLSGPAIPNGYKTDFFFDTKVNFVGGGSQTLTDTLFSGDNRYLVSREGTQVIESIQFFNLHSTSTKNNQPDLFDTWNFQSIKQVSFDGVLACTGDLCEPRGGGGVPEPGTWALMIMGFGAAGALLRRRRTVFG